MCLITYQRIPLVNHNPIRAYKVLTVRPTLNVWKRLRHITNEYISPIMEFDYTYFVHSNNLIKGVIPRVVELREVHEGFHLYIDLEATKTLLEKYSISSHCKGVVFECEIPSNSYCIESYNGKEICTNQFRFIKEIKI